jgi:hypothetical protein
MTMLTDCQPTKRLGFFYLIDSLCKLSEKYQFDGYLKASLFRLDDIINAVLDIQRTNGKFSKKPDKYGLSYITSVKKVLTVWKTKKWLNEFDWNNNINMLDMLLKLNPQPLSKEAIFRRMEEDRDRQKRQREDSWLASSNEFQNAWTKCQSLTKQDFELFGEFTRKFESC